MRIPKIGFSLQNTYPIPITQMFPLLHQAGFRAISPKWTPNGGLSPIVTAARNLHMQLQSLHGPSANTAWLWDPNCPDAHSLRADILKAIDDCADFHIPILVLHAWSGFTYTLPSDEPWFGHFDQIVGYAQTKGVTIAFENLQGESFLQALLTRYQGCDHVGYCWDSGHELCYTHDRNFLSSYGDRLIMTHLNDNLGLRDPNGTLTSRDDLHFLPYDGVADWDEYIRRLQKARHLDTLNFELKITSGPDRPAHLNYAAMPLEDYIMLAGIRARKIAEKYAENL